MIEFYTITTNNSSEYQLKRCMENIYKHKGHSYPTRKFSTPFQIVNAIRIKMLGFHTS